MSNLLTSCSMHDVFRVTVLVKITYCSPAWSGLCSASDRLRLDTQLFFSIHPLKFDSIISHLQYALQQISSWMTANLFTLYSLETEFLLIGLKNHLAKIHNSSLDTSYSARNLGFILSQIKLNVIPKLVYLFKNFRVHIIQNYTTRYI